LRNTITINDEFAVYPIIIPYLNRCKGEWISSFIKRPSFKGEERSGSRRAISAKYISQPCEGIPVLSLKCNNRFINISSLTKFIRASIGSRSRPPSTKSTQSIWCVFLFPGYLADIIGAVDRGIIDLFNTSSSAADHGGVSLRMELAGLGFNNLGDFEIGAGKLGNSGTGHREDGGKLKRPGVRINNFVGNYGVRRIRNFKIRAGSRYPRQGIISRVQIQSKLRGVHQAGAKLTIIKRRRRLGRRPGYKPKFQAVRRHTEVYPHFHINARHREGIQLNFLREQILRRRKCYHNISPVNGYISLRTLNPRTCLILNGKRIRRLEFIISRRLQVHGRVVHLVILKFTRV